MKSCILFAVLGMSVAAPSLAVAADGHMKHGSGRYEWRHVPQVGPRATVPALKWVWVPARARTVDCDCDMMKMSAADCMNSMRHVDVMSAR